MTIATETVTRPRTLIVFDYDLSLVDVDCEQYFFSKLAPKLFAEVAASLTAPPASWTAMVDEMLGEFSKRMPHISRETMIETVATVPVSPKAIDAIKLAVDQHDAAVVIISDANEHFIQSMLDRRGLNKYIQEVHTNRSWWADEKSNRLHEKPYHPEESEPHGCEWCPSNMCKGRILDEVRSKGNYDLVLYVGDGSGDFCPSTRLTSKDTVFARANSPDGKSYGLLEKIEANRAKVQARVVQWHSSDDIYDHFALTLKEKAASLS